MNGLIFTTFVCKLKIAHVNKKEEKELKTLNVLIEALRDKKAEDIVLIDLSHTENAVTDYFVITNGTSDRHVNALADTVLDRLEEQLDLDPWHKEGMENKEWILLDYIDIVVHIFQAETRAFYQIEELWADAEITYINE